MVDSARGEDRSIRRQKPPLNSLAVCGIRARRQRTLSLQHDNVSLAKARVTRCPCGRVIGSCQSRRIPSSLLVRLLYAGKRRPIGHARFVLPLLSRRGAFAPRVEARNVRNRWCLIGCCAERQDQDPRLHYRTSTNRLTICQGHCIAPRLATPVIGSASPERRSWFRSRRRLREIAWL